VHERPLPHDLVALLVLRPADLHPREVCTRRPLVRQQLPWVTRGTGPSLHREHTPDVPHFIAKKDCSRFQYSQKNVTQTTMMMA
jgi:hypothetical protein